MSAILHFKKYMGFFQPLSQIYTYPLKEKRMKRKVLKAKEFNIMVPWIGMPGRVQQAGGTLFSDKHSNCQ